MALVRIVTERLLLFLFGITRLVFLAQGLAIAPALLSAPMLSGPDVWPWLGVAVRSSVLTGATLFVAGIALFAAGRVRAPRVSAPGADGASGSGWPWPSLLGLSLVALPAITYAGVSDLVALWREISIQLEGIGFWKELQRSGPYSGVVLLPIMVALFVPSLETSAAFFLIAAPLAMVVLLLTRSPRFTTLFAMLIACQAGLVIASLIAADAFSRLAAEAVTTMIAAKDVEVHEVAAMLGHTQGVLAATATTLVAPALGYLAWLPFLLMSRSVGVFFAAGSVSPRVQPPA